MKHLRNRMRFENSQALLCDSKVEAVALSCTEVG